MLLFDFYNITFFLEAEKWNFGEVDLVKFFDEWMVESGCNLSFIFDFKVSFRLFF